MLANSLPRERARAPGRTFPTRFWLLLWLVFFTVRAGAALQFDVFLGYDGLMPEASWFPLVCEIKNDGAPFTSVVEVGEANSQGRKTRMVVELPTGTLKRVVLPLFSEAKGYRRFDVRLLDEQGKVRSEQLGVQARRTVPAELPLFCGLPRTVSGMPVLKQGASGEERQLVTARLQPSVFPDNPLSLEGMDTLYLNSERAAELSIGQVTALYAWLHGGGHLIVGIEQIGDITSRPWLKELMPCEVSDMANVELHFELQQWLRSDSQESDGDSSGLGMRARPNRPRFDDPDDPAFESSSAQFVIGAVRNGEVLVKVEGRPAIVEAPKGRGRITVLLFNPEREPFRSWKSLPAFWSKVAGVPQSFYTPSGTSQHQYRLSSDGIFGAILDTRQVNKLPYHWLLLLLVVYLVVIGPLDMYWLRKINKPMLTWVTFPCYVVFFSLLIYFIGYMLRAGESEWNELHLVDVIPAGEKAEFRGRTYASVYAPSNLRFPLEGTQKYATFRPEFAGSWGGHSSVDKGDLLVTGDNYRAEVFVPVWTSQLLVSDWWQPGGSPLKTTLSLSGGEWRLTVENVTGRPMSDAHLAIGSVIIPLGKLPAGRKDFNLSSAEHRPLAQFVLENSQQFTHAVQSRQQAFGGSQSGRLNDAIRSSLATSFLSQSPQQNQPHGGFLIPPGLDLCPALENGGAILLAWDAGQTPTKTNRKFSAKRSSQNTLWRVVVR